MKHTSEKRNHARTSPYTHHAWWHIYHVGLTVKIAALYHTEETLLSRPVTLMRCIAARVTTTAEAMAATPCFNLFVARRAPSHSSMGETSIYTADSSTCTITHARNRVPWHPHHDLSPPPYHLTYRDNREGHGGHSVLNRGVCGEDTKEGAVEGGQQDEAGGNAAVQK